MIKLRRVIATLSLVAILSTLVGATAFAAYSDVSSGDWFYTPVTQLVTDGVFDGTKAMFNPGNDLQRDEAAKIVVLAVPLEGTIDPLKSTFSDVPTTAWSHEYVELAAAHGVVGGYKDAAGNLTGKYGPADKLTRGQYAKMIVEAFELTSYTPDSPTFSDVAETDWEYPYVETAYHWSIIDGYSNGTFGKNLNVKRSEAAKMTYTAKYEAVERPDGEEPPSGDLTVDLSADNPVGVTYGDGTAFNPVLSLELTAGAEDASIDSIAVHKTGLTLDSNIAGVSVWVGTKRYGNIVTVSDNVATVSFTGDPIEIAAGDSAIVDVKVNIDSAAGSGTMQWYLNEAADIDSGGDVEGSFPLYGDTFGTVDGLATVGSLTVDSSTISTSTRQIDVGVTDQLISKFSFQAGANEDLAIHQITLRNNGNATDGDVTNFAWVDQTGTDLATVESTDDKSMTFDFSDAPIEIAKGTTKYFTVEGDVIKGSTRTVQFLIDNDYDIVAYGDSTSSGILPVGGATNEGSSFPVGDSSPSSATFNQITVKEGTLTVSKDSSSPSGNIGVGSKEVVFGTWKIDAVGEEIEVRKVGFDLDSGDIGSLGTTTGLSGTVKLVKGYGTAEEATVYSIAANDADLFDDDTATATSDQFTLSSYFTVPAGESETLSVVGDVASTATAGTYLTAELGNVYYKKMSSNNLATAASTDVAGNRLTAIAATVSLSANATFGNESTVAGGPGTKIGSFTLQSGAAEGISVQTIIIDVTVGGATAIGEVTNLKLKVGGTQIGSTVAGPAAADNSFTVSGELLIAKSESKNIDVYADISTGAATATATGSIQTLTAAAGDIVYVGDVSQTSGSTGISATNFQTITVRSSGTLTVAPGTQVASGVVHAAETGREVMSFKLTSKYEDVRVDQVLIETTNGGSNLQNVTLKDSAGTTIKTGISVISDNVTLSGLNLVVPKDTTKTYKLYVDSTNSGTMISAETINFRLGSVDATGQNSGATITERAVTSELGADSNLGHYALGDIVFESAGLDDFGAITTAAPNEGVDLNTTGLTMAKDQAAAAANTVAATERFAKMPGVKEACVISSTACETAVADGDLIYLYDADATANTGFFLNDTAFAASTIKTAGVVSGHSLNAAGTILTADVTLAAGDMIVYFKTGMTSAALTPAASNPAYATGDVLAYTNLDVATQAGFYLVTETIAANALNGVGTMDFTGEADLSGETIADGDMVVKLNKVSTEAVTTVGTTTATYEYYPGDVVFVYKGTASVNTTNGATWAVVENHVRQGTTWAADSLGGSTTLADGSSITKVFEDALIDGGISTAYDSELTVSNVALDPLTEVSISQQNQVVARYSIKADGPVGISVESIKLFCTGGWVTNTEFSDNPIEVWVNGTKRFSDAEDAADCQTGTGRNVDFWTPVDIDAGASVTFEVKYNTAATAGQATSETLSFMIDGAQGKVGAENAGVDWYFLAADPSPGTEPTEAAPATMSDSYPVSGTTLTY